MRDKSARLPVKQLDITADVLYCVFYRASAVCEALVMHFHQKSFQLGTFMSKCESPQAPFAVLMWILLHCVCKAFASLGGIWEAFELEILET